MERNELYPLFVKPDALQLLIIGGGDVALEKLSFLLKSSPKANVKLVATFYREATQALVNQYQLTHSVKHYEISDLDGVHIVIAATDSKEVNRQIYDDARAKGILVNVADTPMLCDFYLGGVVTKGNVKIAISTNGQSPTLAKRLRQFFEDVIPDDIHQLAANLNHYRSGLKGDFETKVRVMNELTKGMLEG
jgi:precorrin-2 dehydrogenase/sirohydrochlorin ferrochelatase